MLSLHDCLLVLSVSGTNILNIFENGALIVILAPLVKDLDFKESDIQWPLSIYALLNASLLLPCGRVADIIGSRMMFLLGTAWFSIWSIAAGFAQNKFEFIFFVGMTGIGAAANTPTGIGILTGHFKEGKSRNRALAVLGAGTGVGYVAGLILGGFLTRTAVSWRAVFFVQGGIAFAFLVAGYFTIPHTPSDRLYTKGLDLVGGALSITGFAGLIFSLSFSTAASKGWRTPWIPVLLAVSLIILVIFVLYERHQERKGNGVILPISIWSKPDKRMMRYISLVFFCWSSFNSITYLLNVFWQEVHNLSPVQVAIRLAPTALTSFIVSLAVGILLGYIRPYWISLTSLLAGGAAAITVALLSFDSPYWPLPLLALIFSACNDAIYIIANLQISKSLDEDSQALAGGIFNVATRLGASFGLSLSTTVFINVQNRYSSLSTGEAMVKGIDAAGWSCLGLTGVAFLIACFCWDRDQPASDVESQKDVVDKTADTSTVTSVDPTPAIELDLQLAPGVGLSSEKMDGVSVAGTEKNGTSITGDKEKVLDTTRNEEQIHVIPRESFS